MAIFDQAVANVFGNRTGHFGSVDARHVVLESLPLRDPRFLRVRNDDQTLEHGRSAAVERICVAAELEEWAVWTTLVSESLLAEGG